MILRLFEDGEFRTKLGENASRSAQQFTWERECHDFARILEEVLQRKSNLPAKNLRSSRELGCRGQPPRAIIWTLPHNRRELLFSLRSYLALAEFKRPGGRPPEH